MSDSKEAAHAAFVPLRGITKENMLFVLPPALRKDESAGALADATAEALAGRLEEIDRLRIVSNIDNLEEGLLDILAYDFKVDWWNPDYTLEEKRRVLRDSWYVHRRMGTRAAVETALKAVYRDAVILEWFEYGGKPGYFRLWTDVTNEDFVPALRREILRRMDYYKRLSAHLESVGYWMKAEPSQAWAYLAYGGQVQKRWGEIKAPPSIGPPEAGTAAIYGGVLAGMAGSAERTVVVPTAVQPPICSLPRLTARFLYVGQILKCWDGMIPPPPVGPPKAKVRAVYGSVLAGMAGSAERTVEISSAVKLPECGPPFAAVRFGLTVIRGRTWADANLHSGPPKAEARAVYGAALAGMAVSLRGAGVDLKI